MLLYCGKQRETDQTPAHLDLEEFRFEGDVALTLEAPQSPRPFGDVLPGLGGSDTLDQGGADRQLGEDVHLLLGLLELFLRHGKTRHSIQKPLRRREQFPVRREVCVLDKRGRSATHVDLSCVRPRRCRLTLVT